jgi:hypothetical protein|tara:strand:- start:416 stop:637 length:222 start_codon:yes stop_codon:yes gene_type:complete
MTVQYIHYVIATVADELEHTGKRFRADWRENQHDVIDMESLKVFVSEKDSNVEAVLDYDGILYNRATRLGQIH